MVFAGIYILFFLPRYIKQGVYSFLVHTLFFLYLELLLYFTIFPIVLSFDRPSINLIPFRDYLSGYGDSEMQIILNVILFVPFGFFMPFFIGKGWYKTFLLGFLMTVFIELSQPWITIDRVCDVTDVITNTSGALIGYWVYFFLSPLFSWIEKHTNWPANYHR